MLGLCAALKNRHFLEKAVAMLMSNRIDLGHDRETTFWSHTFAMIPQWFVAMRGGTAEIEEKLLVVATSGKVDRETGWPWSVTSEAFWPLVLPVPYPTILH